MKDAAWASFVVAAELPDNDPPQPVALPYLTEHAWYDKGACCVRAAADEDAEWGVLDLDLCCAGPPINHQLSYELECAGTLNDALAISESFGSVAQFLLEHGVAPGQHFYLHVELGCFQHYEGDWDTEVTFEVVGVVPWDRERVCSAWEAFYGRRHLMSALDLGDR